LPRRQQTLDQPKDTNTISTLALFALKLLLLLFCIAPVVRALARWFVTWLRRIVAGITAATITAARIGAGAGAEITGANRTDFAAGAADRRSDFRDHDDCSLTLRY
jgi:hypothetical protein